jgi:hypothetical protein
MSSRSGAQDVDSQNEEKEEELDEHNFTAQPRANNDEQRKMQIRDRILEPGPYDVLMGRGGKQRNVTLCVFTHHHIGSFCNWIVCQCTHWYFS